MSITNLSDNDISTDSQVKQIAIFGGTFDPIHCGHINAATQMASWLELKQVRLMPAHIPPHKSAAAASSHDRAAMVNLACQQHPLFVCDCRELTREKPSYTVETLTEFKQEFPNVQLLFFIGMDSLLSFTSWYQWHKILELTHLVVSTRPGFDISRINDDTRLLLNEREVASPVQLKQSRAGKILIFEQNHWDISSTEIREKIAEQQDLSDLLPQSVTNYIDQHQLYQSSKIQP